MECGASGETSVWAQSRGKRAQTDASKGYTALCVSGYPNPLVLSVSVFYSFCLRGGWRATLPIRTSGPKRGA
jgi:hypothetical protein